jgi:ATP-dependent RNA helicase DDX27
MGFRDEVHEVVKTCPAQRQTMLFSATLTRDVDSLARLSLRAPVEIAADPLYGTASRLTQEVIRIRQGHEVCRPLR